MLEPDVTNLANFCRIGLTWVGSAPTLRAMTFSSFRRALCNSPWPGVLLAWGLACATALSNPVDTPPPLSEPIPLLSEAGIRAQLDQFRESVSTTTSDLVLTAMGFLGVPYKRGGNTEYTGFDCSGFVRATYERTLGLVLPRRAEEQAKATTTIRKEELRPGDLVFFNTMRRTFSHVGIYVGEGKFIHAPRAGAKVRVEDMRQAYWTKRFNGARRVEGATIDPAQANTLLSPPVQ